MIIDFLYVHAIGHQKSSLWDIPRIVVIAAKAACKHNNRVITHQSSLDNCNMKLLLKKSIISLSFFKKRKLNSKSKLNIRENIE